MRVSDCIGMAFSNLVAFFIILTAASTLHAHGLAQISTSAEAATALRPLAGRFAFALFACGIVGTGLLAVPVLAASAAYGIGEACRWSVSLERTPKQATPFYAVICAATILRAVAELPAYRPGEGSFLGRSSEWARFGPINGGHYDYRFQPKGDG